MEDLKHLYDILEKIQMGQWSIPLVLTIILGLFIFYYFRRKVESIAQLSAKKALEKFKTDLSNGKEYLFRDEKIRAELLSYVGKLSIDKKISSVNLISILLIASTSAPFAGVTLSTSNTLTAGAGIVNCAEMISSLG